MSFDIDAIIFIGFLVATVFLGLFSSYGVKNIKEFAVGDRNFSTATLVATIVATWISGEFFYSNIHETYTNGLYVMWISLGDHIYLFLIGVFFAKRMGEFLGKLSIAEAMGDLFGQRVRVVTAVVGFVSMAGLVGIQLKLTGLLFEHAMGIPSVYGTIIATIIVTLYSSLGGIKSVTFTDVIQFITFGVTIPIVAYVLLRSIENIDIVTNTLVTNPAFDYKQVFDFSNPMAMKQLILFLSFVIPTFSPVTFQRIAMARNTKQIKQSFVISSIVCLFLGVMLQWIAILILSINPSLNSDEVFKLIILDSYYVGLKGLVLAGIMATIMSTVDSCINSASVLAVHDFLKPLNFSVFKNELISARFVSLTIGIFSLLLSLREGSLLDLLVITFTFYTPIVTVPFMMAIFGFRSSEKSVLLGMASGLFTVIMWDYVLHISIGNAIPFSMLANLVVLMLSHYILKQPGGWVGIKDYSEVIEARRARRRLFKKLWFAFKAFNVIEYCKNNYPKRDGLISILGFFVMISVFTSAQTLPKEYQLQYSELLDAIYPIALCSSALMISFPLWLQPWREKKLIGIIWNFVSFAVLVCFSFLMVLISKFSEIQLMAFMVNITILSALNKWQSSLFNIVVGVFLVTIGYQYYYHVNIAESTEMVSQFKILYLLLLVSSTLVLFLKPRQEDYELAVEKIDHLSGRIDAKDQEVQEALALKAEFIRNVNHEYKTPITGVMSLAEALVNSYDKISDEQKLDAIKVILESSRRLKAYDENIVTLAKLNKPNYILRFEEINFSTLLHERIKSCTKLYDSNKDNRDYVFDIDEPIIINADKTYITQLIDNLIINAIKYCEKGKISISAKKKNGTIYLDIQDEGIGIPKEELCEIFEPFVVSSKTRSTGGGRGIGLSAAKRIVEVHNGTIKAESDGVKGTVFTVVLPG